MAKDSSPTAKIKSLLPNTKQQELLTRVHEWLEDAKQARQKYERQWYENLAFYGGKQYVQWTTSAASATGISRLYEPPAPPWRVRIVSNKIKPVIRKELAKITKEKPQPYVIPASTDDDDLAAARAGEAIFDHLTRELEFDRTVRQMLFWELICGTSFIKDWYNPTVPDAQGHKGRIFCEPVNPFQLYVADPTEPNMENQPYVIHGLVKTTEWVQDVYDKRVEADTAKVGGVMDGAFLKAMGLPSLPKKAVTVYECWMKPSARYPQGAVITWAGDTILTVADSWPFENQDYPFTKFGHVPTGAFYDDSVIVDMIPLQKEMNRTRSQIVEAKNRMAKPQLIAPRGSVDPRKVTTEPGLIILYTPGFQKPEPIPLVSIPNYVIDEIARCQQDMDDISGQHEISKGSTPTGVSAATAISFLQEQDDAMIAPTITSLEEGIARIGRHWLGYVKQFWEAERTIRVLGENQAYEVFNFNKTAIAGNTDLHVQAGSATPRSTAAKQAFITELMDKKYITPQQGLRYLQMAETSRMHEEMAVSERQAQRENLRLANGATPEEVTVNTWDEHAIHMQEHDVFRRRQAFERLDDEIKANFEAHVTMHRQLVGQAQGTPIGPGESLPPPPSEGAPPVGAEGDLMQAPGEAPMPPMNGNGAGPPPQSVGPAAEGV